MPYGIWAAEMGSRRDISRKVLSKKESAERERENPGGPCGRRMAK